MKYHLRIKQERRISTPEQPRTLATVVEDKTLVPTGQTVNGMPQFDVVANDDQRYMLNDGIINDYANIECVEQLHESGKWVECIYGDNSQNKGWYMGWPLYRSEQEYIDGEDAKRVAAEQAALARQQAEDEARAKWEAEHPNGEI